MTEQKKLILQVANEINRLEIAKAELGEQIGEQKSKIKALGIKLADFNAVRRLWKLEEEDRRESLEGVALCAEALGVKLQSDLFEGQDDIFEDGDIVDESRLLEAG